MQQVDTPHLHEPAFQLTHSFLLNFPWDAARHIETLTPADAATELSEHSPRILAQVMEKLSPGTAVAVLPRLSEEALKQVLPQMDAHLCANLLSQLSEREQQRLLSLVDGALAKELVSLLDYPENSAGSLMQPKVAALNKSTLVKNAIEHLRQQGFESLNHLFLLDNNQRLSGSVDVSRLILANPSARLSSLVLPDLVFVESLDHKDEIIEKLEKSRLQSIPVVNIERRLVGVIEGASLVVALKENLATDMQTMVGVSKDERALSSSAFAVRKRQPWLQINLLTAFLAAAVVGVFEDTISKYTALAILLPIAAGQSGNAGAQALAVTMRGLTLREISMRHWLRVMFKEFGAGLLNGLGIAITCSAGIYVWSQSYGLALIMALAMIISMTIAGVSGALVPILLKRFGLDPAQSSSIVLTTVTDIAGFMSFLGIATALSSMLVAG